jgi:uncharacterized RDD family membrane protein YckC
MNCPKCQSTELDASGVCAVCGPAAAEGTAPAGPAPDEKESGNYSGLIEMDYSSPAEAVVPETPEMPRWRQDLARRLREIRQKREAEGSEGTAENGTASLPVSERSAGESEGDSAPGIVHTPRKPAKPPRSLPSQGLPGSPKRPSPKPAAADLPLFQSRESGRRSPEQTKEPSLKRASPASDPDSKDIRSLIDSVVSRTPPAKKSPAAESQNSTAAPAPLQLEDRLILVSRTLSGLVDLLIVALCTGALIIATDITTGIDIFDRKSVIIYALLLLVVFFVYSAFFLGTANQTIGMMLTDLKLVDSRQNRPRMRQILWRCFGYLAALLMLGVGLLWGCFDRECRCLHDRISDTRIVRL